MLKIKFERETGNDNETAIEVANGLIDLSAEYSPSWLQEIAEHLLIHIKAEKIDKEELMRNAYPGNR